MAQINQGMIEGDWEDGDLVTPDRLNRFVKNASLAGGSITEQVEMDPNSVNSSDKQLIYDASLSALRQTTVGDILNSGLSATLDNVDVNSLSAQTRLSITQDTSPVITATSYTYASNSIVSVASPNHGLVVGDVFSITCTSTSGDDGSKFSGRFRVASVSGDGNAFTYIADGTLLPSTGTATWRKERYVEQKSLVLGEDGFVDGNLRVKGKIFSESTGSLLVPVGTSAQRPTNPETGDIRYNSDNSTLEIFNGTVWVEGGGGGGSPFNATGGSYVLGPSVSTFVGTISSTDGLNVTCVCPNPHDVSMGQIIEVSGGIFTDYNGYYLVVDITNANQFKYRRISSVPAATSVNEQKTFRKSGNHKVHVYNVSGSFTTGAYDGLVDILIVGGGAKSVSYTANGGGGGVLYIKNFLAKRNTTYSVVVGSKGGVTASGNGGDSSFGTIDFSFIAYGGKVGSGTTGGNGGGHNLGYSGTTNTTNVATGAGARTAGIYIPIGQGNPPNSVINPVYIGGEGYYMNITNYPIPFGWGGGIRSSSYSSPFQILNNRPIIFSGSSFANTGTGGHIVFNGTTAHAGGEDGCVIIRYTSRSVPNA